MNTFTKCPEEGAVFTTELDASKSAAQQQGASSIESVEVKYLLKTIKPRQVELLQ